MKYINSRKYGSSVQVYSKQNGDYAYYITYKDLNNKLKRVKIGDKSQGINEHYCYRKRSELINALRLGEDPPADSQRKKETF